jgi:tRNA(Ile)-lysidine synthase
MESVETLAQSVLSYIRHQGLLKAGDRVGVAVSGGADSVALLRLFLELRPELGIVLSVVHFNHNLRGTESDEDEQFVAALAQRQQLAFHCGRGNVKKLATDRHLSTEAAARQLRYQYFRQLMDEGRLNTMATGHTLDDQAETVLLRVVRGAGTRGLAGIYPQLLVNGSQFSVVRPLLHTRRKQLQAYLAEIRQDWREDSSNRDLRHARNLVRHGIVPRLERSLNPSVRETLAETADIARSEEEFWQEEVTRVLPEVWRAEHRTLRLAELSKLPLALQRRVIRAAAESLDVRLEFRHVQEILELGPVTAKSAMLPGGSTVSRAEDGLRFDRPCAKEAVVSNYEYALAVPGIVQVGETQGWFEAVLIPGSAAPGYNPDHMFDPALLRSELTVRNWRPGDRFWPAHRKSPKKIKELLQERKLTGTERKLWPVVASGEQIVWVRGFPAPAQLRPRDGSKQALVIREFCGREHPNA